MMCTGGLPRPPYVILATLPAWSVLAMWCDDVYGRVPVPAPAGAAPPPMQKSWHPGLPFLATLPRKSVRAGLVSAPAGACPRRCINLGIPVCPSLRRCSMNVYGRAPTPALRNSGVGAPLIFHFLKTLPHHAVINHFLHILLKKHLLRTVPWPLLIHLGSHRLMPTPCFNRFRFLMGNPVLFPKI